MTNQHFPSNPTHLNQNKKLYNRHIQIHSSFTEIVTVLQLVQLRNTKAPKLRSNLQHHSNNNKFRLRKLNQPELAQLLNFQPYTQIHQRTITAAHKFPDLIHHHAKTQLSYPSIRAEFDKYLQSLIA